MSATARITKIKSVKAETDIAVLQVQVKNLDEKFDGIKQDIRDLRDSVETHADSTQGMIAHMQVSSAAAHSSLGKKIAELEKWKWMVMGGAAVAGALGFHVVSKLFGV